MREKYAAAGVDINLKDAFLERLRPLAASTADARVLGGIGHFGGFLDVRELKNYDEPVLVGCTDGVGTKLRLAARAGAEGLRAVGIDLVAMSVNDLVACGAKPLFFLDYYAAASIDPAHALPFLEGVVEGCRQAGCPLIGGESAQMPGLYAAPDFDAAGFCVGVVERSRILGPERSEAGLALIGLPSAGLHSNGFSLVRRYFPEPRPELLIPTKIYVRTILALASHLGLALRGCAHITGGGIYENVPRILSKTLAARLDARSWKVPAIMREVQKAAALSDAELFAIFNGGLGMVLAIEAKRAAEAIEFLRQQGEEAMVVGAVVARGDGPPIHIDGLAKRAEGPPTKESRRYNKVTD